jgi:hypothetical protein
MFLHVYLHYKSLKFVRKMYADVRIFLVAVQNWFVRCGGCSVTNLYNGSYRLDVKFMLW